MILLIPIAQIVFLSFNSSKTFGNHEYEFLSEMKFNISK